MTVVNMLHLGLSYNCNMRCSHCFVNKKMDKLSNNQIKNTIDYMIEQGLYMVVFTFGEPLLAKNFCDISNYLYDKGIFQVVMSNGSYINEKLITILKRNVSRVFISIDSAVPQKHDNNRNYKNAFANAFDTINKLQKNKINVGLAVTINNSNLEELNDIVELAKKHNIKNISFLRQRDNDKIFKLNSYKFYSKFYCDYLEGKIAEDMNIMFHDPTLRIFTKKLYDENKITKDKYNKYMEMNSCNIKNTLSLAPNGDILLCNLTNKKIGNICDDSIDEIMKKRGDSDECFICCS